MIGLLDENIGKSDGSNRHSNNNGNDNFRIQKPIFVTGAPRSGLGIIHQILTSHHQVTSITPNSMRKIIPHFRQRNNMQGFNSLMSTSPFSQISSKLGSLIHFASGNHIHYNERQFWNEYFEPYIHATHLDVTDEITDYYRSIVSQLQLLNNRSRFVSTMPEHSFRVLALNAIFSDAKFIHIIRNPRIVSCSTFAISLDNKCILDDDPYFKNLGRILSGIHYYETSESSELIDYELAVQIIIAKAREAISFRGRRFLELRYEDLVTDPRQWVIKVLSFCELIQNSDFVYSSCMRIRNENEKWYPYLNTQNF